MKRILAAVLLAVMLLAGAAAAYADSWQADAGVEIPDQIRTALKKEKLSGYTATSCAECSGFAFVVMQNSKGSCLLYVFRQKNNKWVYQFRTASAIPQGTGRTYVRAEGRKTVTVAQENDSMEYWVKYAEYECRDSSRWCLTNYYDRARKMRVSMTENSITYYGGADYDRKQGRVHGTIQTDLRYVNLSVIPSTLAEAGKKYTVAPVIPAGTLSAESIRFTGGKKYPVYSGPGENYVRGAGGKAVVSTNDWIQVFGRENGWIMIQYAIDSTHCRIGYISEKALPKSARADSLGLLSETAYTANAVYVTDDPFFSGKEIGQLAEGTPVTLLGTMGDYAYIEAKDPQPVRGFISTAGLTAAENRFAVYTSADGRQYNWFTVEKLHFGEDHRVTAVSGYYERYVTGGEYDTSEKAAGSEATYRLSADFRADMISSTTEAEMTLVPVTDLYQWYIDAYLDRSSYDGHELVFSCDLTDEQRDTASPDFWFITTQIELNEQGEIRYMRYVYVPWG